MAYTLARRSATPTGPRREPAGHPRGHAL